MNLRLEQNYNRVVFRNLSLCALEEFVACLGEHLGDDITLTIAPDDELEEGSK